MDFRCSNCGQEFSTDYLKSGFVGWSGKLPRICPRCGAAFSNMNYTCVNCGHKGSATEFVGGTTLGTIKFSGMTVGRAAQGRCPKCSWDIQQMTLLRFVVCPGCHKKYPTIKGKTAGTLMAVNRWGILKTGYLCPDCKTRMYASGKKVNEQKARAKKSIKLGIAGILASFLLLGLFLSIPGIVVAIKCIRDKCYTGLATLGLLISIIGVAIQIAVIIFGIQVGYIV